MPRLRGRIERYGSVPEDMHQALSSGLGVPDAAAYDAAGPGHPTHLENGPVHVGDELQDEERQRSIEGCVGVRQRPGVADIKAQARRRCVLTRKRDVGLRGINSNDLRPARAGRGRHRESACTTTDVEQPVSVSEPGEVEEYLRQSAGSSGPYILRTPRRRRTYLRSSVGFDHATRAPRRRTILPFSGGGERARSDRPLRSSATAGYPAIRCALKARKATAAPASSPRRPSSPSPWTPRNTVENEG